MAPFLWKLVLRCSLLTGRNYIHWVISQIFTWKIKILPKIKNPAKDICYGNLDVRGCHRCRSSSGKWLVGPRRTSNRATSLPISIGDTGRCYEVSLGCIGPETRALLAAIPS